MVNYFVLKVIKNNCVRIFVAGHFYRKIFKINLGYENIDRYKSEM